VGFPHISSQVFLLTRRKNLASYGLSWGEMLLLGRNRDLTNKNAEQTKKHL
jgi:hypothetical protein